jgi:PAS domain S-box-containing protein
MVRNDEPRAGMGLGAPAMLGPIHAYASGCFFVFGIIYLAFIDSTYMFFSNTLFGTLVAANWFLLPRRVPDATRAWTLLSIVFVGLVNVAVHLGTHPLPMVFWGMSIAIAAAFLFDLGGVLAWVGLTLGFYPLTAWLKAGPLSDAVIPLDAFQEELLSAASYAGLLSFLAFSFVLFHRRLDRAFEALRTHAADLRKSESFLAEVQQLARIGSYDFDLTRGTWTSSPLLDEIFGIDADYRRDLAGWLPLVHPDDRASMARYFEQDVLGRRQRFDREYRLARNDQGHEVWIHGRGVLRMDADGRPVRMIGTIQDISELKRNEEMRRQLEARLFQAQKLESLGVLAGGIAHDFHNLLTGILGNVTLARSNLPQESTDLSMPLQRAETAAQRAAELTRQMLAFSGRGQFVIQALDINHALTEMVELMKSSLSQKVEVRFDLDASAPRMMADASQIRQVIMNLIINAAEAVGDQPGVITIHTEIRFADLQQLSTGFTSDGMTGGRYACIEIVDTGCGMDAETRARVFEPFYSTKFTGRGLGLAAVLGIVKGHGGAIWLRSAPGHGSCFTMLFPLAPDDAPGIPSVRVRTADSGSGRVLVIDDEELVRDVIRTVLQHAGYDVLEAEDGAAGLQVVRTQGHRIDMVLLDLTMPRMGGVEVFAEIKKHSPDLPVVLMSGYSRGNVLKLFAETLPDDFLEKPFHHEDLLAVVKRNVRELPTAGER